MYSWFQRYTLKYDIRNLFSTMWTSMKHNYITLCIILVFSHCTISLRCYECFDGDVSALDCLPPLVSLTSVLLLSRLNSCEKQRSVFCKGHCSNVTISGCGSNYIRGYSELTSGLIFSKILFQECVFVTPNTH